MRAQASACARDPGGCSDASALSACTFLAAGLSAARSAQEARARAGGGRQHADGARVHAASTTWRGRGSASSARSTRRPRIRTCRKPPVWSTNASTKWRRRSTRSRPPRGWARTIPAIQNSYAGFLCRTGKAAAGEKLFLEVARRIRSTRLRRWRCSTPACAWAVRATWSMRSAISIARWPSSRTCRRRCCSSAISRSSRGDSKQALDYVQRYLAVNPPTPEVLWLGFRAERKLGDNTGAGVLCAAHPDRVSRFRAGADAALPASIDERGRASARAAAQGGARAARDERAKDGRRHASRRVGHRCARGGRLSAHRPVGVRARDI